MIRVIDKFWHQTLRQPYRLARTIDTGKGQTVILLHGIGRTGQVWKHVVSRLEKLPYRVVAFDLLGFGKSPKPDWPEYTVDDHAQAVIASIKRLRGSGKVILVGHSMGCLVAVRVARLQPDLVKHLVLYEMPLYEGLPEKRKYRLRLDLYFKLYQKIIAYKPTFDAATAKRVERLGLKIAGLEVNKATWGPFIKSLEHTIMKQTAAADIKKLPMPMDVIYGSFDMLVIRGKALEFFGSDSGLITAHTVRARHVISPKASQFIVDRLEAAEGRGKPVKPKRPSKMNKIKNIKRRAKRTD